MKAFFLCAALLSVFALGSANDIEEMKKQKYIECKTQEEASDADVESLLKRELPKTRGAMCILACANEKFGLVEDGKLNIEQVTKMINKRFEGNPKLISDAVEIGKECLGQEGDRCEKAGKFYECCINNLTKRGYKVETL